MFNIRIAVIAAAAALQLAGAASAQPSNPGASGADLSEGEIRKVDKDSKKITIKHGPLKNLDMPGMTMVFGINDDAMLDKVEAGAKVRFQAEKVDGKFVVTRIEPAR